MKGNIFSATAWRGNRVDSEERLKKYSETSNRGRGMETVRKAISVC